MALGGTCPLEPNKSCTSAPGAESSTCTRQWCGRGAHLGVQDLAMAQPSARLHMKMPRASHPCSLLVLLILATAARGQSGAGPKELQPWLVGLTAVVVFLFIVFALLLLARLWRLRTRRKRGGLQESLGTDRLDPASGARLAAQDSAKQGDPAGRIKTTAF